MPVMFDYESQCGEFFELLVSSADKDAKRLHCDVADTTCDCLVTRKVSSFVVGKPRFQMGAVLNNGQVVSGHFGKDARRDPLKRRKRSGD